MWCTVLKSKLLLRALVASPGAIGEQCAALRVRGVTQCIELCGVVYFAKGHAAAAGAGGITNSNR
jgi:hypothetical protein